MATDDPFPVSMMNRMAFRWKTLSYVWEMFSGAPNIRMNRTAMTVPPNSRPPSAPKSMAVDERLHDALAVRRPCFDVDRRRPQAIAETPNVRTARTRGFQRRCTKFAAIGPSTASDTDSGAARASHVRPRAPRARARMAPGTKMIRAAAKKSEPSQTKSCNYRHLLEALGLIVVVHCGDGSPQSGTPPAGQTL